MAEAGQRIALLLGAEAVLHNEYAVPGGALQAHLGSEYAAHDEVLGVIPDATLAESTRLTLEIGDDEELHARGQRLTQTGLLLDRARTPFELGDEPRPLERELGEFVASLGAPASGRRGRRAQRVTMGKQASP